MDVANGPEAAEFVSKLMRALPPMKPLVLVLKMFLQQRQLNEVRRQLCAFCGSHCHESSINANIYKACL